MLKNKKAQSTIEYIILVTAVIVIIILFMMTPGSVFRTALNGTLADTSDGMKNMSERLKGSRPLSP